MYLPAVVVRLPHKDITSPLGGAFVAAVLRTVVARKCAARSYWQRSEGADDKIGHD